MDRETSRHESVHCTLEAVPKEEVVSNYTYSVPDNSAPYSLSTAPYYYHENASTNEPAAAAPQKPQKHSIKRWLLPLLYGLLLAIIAGVIGGLIGKTISDNKHKGDDATPQRALEPSSCPTTSSSSNTSTPTPTSTVFQRTLAVPTTGCAPDTNFLKTFPYSFSQNSTYLSIPYSTFCDAGWNRDELIALSAATTSDCIEACVMYNSYRKDEDRWCVGGGFIPDWWNQTKAMDESGGMPYNCFLKSNGSGIAKNDRVQEVVGLCLFGGGEGKCG